MRGWAMLLRTRFRLTRLTALATTQAGALRLESKRRRELRAADGYSRGSEAIHWWDWVTPDAIVSRSDPSTRPVYSSILTIIVLMAAVHVCGEEYRPC